MVCLPPAFLWTALSYSYPFYNQLLTIFFIDGLYNFRDGSGLQLRFELIHLNGYKVDLNPFGQILQIIKGEGTIMLLITEEEDTKMSKIKGEILMWMDFQHLGED